MKNLIVIIVFLMIFTSLALPAASTKDLGVQMPGFKIGEHLYRSTAKIYQVIKYIRKKGMTSYTKESFETRKVSVTHLKSTRKSTKWEGINIYRYKKLTYIYIIPRSK